MIPLDEKAAKIEAVLKSLEMHGNTSRACRESGVERPTFLRWVDDDPSLSDRYARATLAGLDAEFDDLDKTAEEIADVQRAKLVVDTKKWKLSRIVPKYGDRMAHTGADGGPIKIEAAIADVLADVYGDED